jgi:hypothetical protein
VGNRVRYAPEDASSSCHPFVADDDEVGLQPLGGSAEHVCRRSAGGAGLGVHAGAPGARCVVGEQGFGDVARVERLLELRRPLGTELQLAWFVGGGEVQDTAGHLGELDGSVKCRLGGLRTVHSDYYGLEHVCLLPDPEHRRRNRARRRTLVMSV